MTTIVRAPASIANLGAGFDILALAVDLWLEVEAEPAPEPAWDWTGEAAGVLSDLANPISVLPFRGQVRNWIPLGVGLGSSAAARLVAAALQEPEADPFPAAVEAEGHPDNVAAAARGGVVAVVDGRIHRLPVPDLEVALLVAAEPFPTEKAREVVPLQVPRADAVHNVGRVGLFVHALHTRDWSLLATAMDDRLHQPYRFALFPWVESVQAAARQAGAHAAALAGAGPSVFALCDGGRAGPVAAAMGAAAGERGRPLVTRISSSGVSLIQRECGEEAPHGS